MSFLVSHNDFLVPPAKAGGNLNRGFLFKDKLLLASFINFEFYESKYFKENNQPKVELPPALAGE